MITTAKTPLTNTNSLPAIDQARYERPPKSSLSTLSSILPDIPSTIVSQKRHSQKRVRFATKLEYVEVESSLPSSREVSPLPRPKPNSRVVDPWRQHAPLYGAYVEYLEKQSKLTTSEIEIRQIPPVPPPPPEPGAEPPTYQHTFIIQSKSPELVIDSITVSAPQSHLPRIITKTRNSTRQHLPAADSYVKQHQIQLTAAPQIVYGKKILNTSNQRSIDTSPQSTLRRAIIAIPTANTYNESSKISQPENLFRAKFANDCGYTKRSTGNLSKPLPDIKTHMYHFAERPILPNNFSRKPSTPGHSLHSQEKSKLKTPNFFHFYKNDQLVQPIIHSTH